LKIELLSKEEYIEHQVQEDKKKEVEESEEDNEVDPLKEFNMIF